MTEPAPPRTSFVVSVFDTTANVWRDVQSTTDKAEAEAMLADIGDKGRLEEFTPRPKKRK